uniref:Uncharacterized protein n=1 Tax=Alexandrium catenella TaxID=2925 RepID=A0A7S1W608_ALECA
MFGADFFDLGHEWDYTVPEQALALESDHTDMVRLPGDFYREADDNTRSASLALEPELLISSFGRLDYGAFPGLSGIPGLVDSAPSWYGYKAQQSASCAFEEQYPVQRVGRFTDASLAPRVAGPFYGLAPCTFSASGCSPAGLGNRLVDFLETQVTSSITKLNREKFTIKADVFIHGAACTLKIRLYSRERGVVVAEFLRRRGSCLCFGSAYRQAGEYLRPLLDVIGMPEASDDCELPPRSCEVDAAEVSPLLDMAGFSDLPSLQAESAAALEEQVRDDKVAASLCTPHAFERFKSLLKVEETAVAHPTAQVLSHLSLRSEAMPCFADEELLSIITSKVQSEVTSSLVQQELAQVLTNALSRCSTTCSARVTEDVKRSLALARMRVPAGCALTRRNSKHAPCFEGIQAPDLRPLPDIAASVQRGGTGPPWPEPPSATPQATFRHQLPADRKCRVQPGS